LPQKPEKGQKEEGIKGRIKVRYREKEKKGKENKNRPLTKALWVKKV